MGEDTPASNVKASIKDLVAVMRSKKMERSCGDPHFLLLGKDFSRIILKISPNCSVFGFMPVEN